MVIDDFSLLGGRMHAHARKLIPRQGGRVVALDQGAEQARLTLIFGFQWTS